MLSEYPLSTIKSRTLTALTLSAITDKPNKITKNVFDSSIKKLR